MKHNEYLTAAIFHAILSICTSFISIFNLPALLTTFTLLTTGIESGENDLMNTKQLLLSKILFLLSIIFTLIFTIIYAFVLF